MDWAQVTLFLMILARMSGFVLFNPIFGRQTLQGTISPETRKMRSSVWCPLAVKNSNISAGFQADSRKGGINRWPAIPKPKKRPQKSGVTSEKNLQLNIDGKDVDLRDYLHEDAHTHLAQQFCGQNGKS